MNLNHADVQLGLAGIISFLQRVYEHLDPVHTALVGPPGPLWAPMGPCGSPWALVGTLGPCGIPWALVGRALLRPLGPWAGPLWTPGLLWAPLGACRLGHCGPRGPCEPPWALVGHALVGSPGRLWAGRGPPWANPFGLP